MKSVMMAVSILFATNVSANSYDPHVQNPKYTGTATYEERPIVVIDTGYDHRHPLLKDRLYLNKFEIPNNGLDDDQNGFVDDVHGWDFGQNDNNPNDFLEKPLFDRVNLPSRFRSGFVRSIINLIDNPSGGHGTHVAGIIAQQTEKAVILPVRIDFKKSDITQQIHKAVLYAIKMKARVVNMSLGGKMKTKEIQRLFTRLKTTFHIAAAQKTLFVIAAGNGDRDLDIENIFPGGLDLPNVLTVGAIDKDHNMASFTNWSEKYVEVYAPGVNIESSWPGGGMKILSGTSMATPFVTGVVADFVDQYPKASAYKLRSILLGKATKKTISKLSGKEKKKINIKQNTYVLD